MYIKSIRIQNFRLLHDSTMDFNNNICLMLGRNNTGKTSFMVLFEKFLKKGTFDFNDFSVQLREELLSINEKTDINDLSIRLMLNIEYTDKDDLCHISEFILDLDPKCNNVNLLFECSLQKDKLLEGLNNKGQLSKDKFIKKHISQYLKKSYYTFESYDDIKTENRYKLVEKDIKDIEKIIDFEIIHAKRSVSSSEETKGTKVLSKLTTEYYNNANENTPDKFEEINKLIDDTDAQLEKKYISFFSQFLNNARLFLNMKDLKVISNLKAKEIINDSSEVVYGDSSYQLPEYLNGLGHMNILYLLLGIEIKKEAFNNKNKDIKLLFIEEPEAHTHPRLQYIFAEKISLMLKDVQNLQTIISTHSPHIVSNHPFENIRYMSTVSDTKGTNIEIKNFHQELQEKYKNEKTEFEFLKEYLSIESSELFFADKVIFIEGISEEILINSFISKFDKEMAKFEEDKDDSTGNKYVPLSSQNITILQAGANAKAFRHFIDFLNIPTLIITDIDTAKAEIANKKTTYKKCKPIDDNCCYTSNDTLKYYLNAPDYNRNDSSFSKWFKDLVEHKCNCVSSYVNIQYQQEENGYYPRSFEDAFININLTELKKHKDNLLGIKNKKLLDTEDNIYDLTESIIDKKSSFASSLLFLSLSSNDVEWNIPKYIWEGFKWLQEQ